jgi:hypothetical protein
MSPAQEFACHMRFQQAWMSRAIRDWHDELWFDSEDANLLSQRADALIPTKVEKFVELAAMAEQFDELSASLRYASIYVAWYGVQEFGVGCGLR